MDPAEEGYLDNKKDLRHVPEDDSELFAGTSKLIFN